MCVTTIIKVGWFTTRISIEQDLAFKCETISKGLWAHHKMCVL